MTQQRLNDLLLLHVHKPITAQLNENDIAKLFIQGVQKGERFFGKQ